MSWQVAGELIIRHSGFVIPSGFVIYRGLRGANKAAKPRPSRLVALK
jgi:hypothetical protein